MTGQLVRMQGLVKGHAGSISVLPHLLSLIDLSNLVSPGSRSNVDGFVPRTQRVNLSIVRQRD